MRIKRMINKTAMLYTLYTVFIASFFVWYLFPSDYFARYIEKSVTSYDKGLSVSIGEVRPALPIGVKLTGLEINTPMVASVPVDYINAGVSFFSLIKLDPVLQFSAGLLGGTLKGSVRLPDRDVNKLSVDNISVKGVDLSLCTRFVEAYLPGGTIIGRLDADGSYEVAGRGHGKVNVVITQLSVKPEKPYLTLDSLSFSEIAAEIELKSKRIQIEKCDIDGQEFDGSIKGSVIVKHPVNRSVLRLSGKFKPEKEFAEKMPLDLVFKKKVNYGDELPFKISGTINKPRFR